MFEHRSELFVVLYMMIVTFWSPYGAIRSCGTAYCATHDGTIFMYETLVCEHSNESY